MKTEFAQGSQKNIKEDADKRAFLKQVLWGAGTIWLLAPLYAVWRYLVSPAEKRLPAAPIRLSTEKAAKLLGDKNYALMRLGDKNVLLRRDGELMKAFNLRCTHAGCVVEWQNAENKFVCPCHGAEFRADGSVLKLPATEPLEELTVRTEQGSITVFDQAKR